ncbi:MAG: NUDIX hydrolase [Oscillospiraceae bacterium]|jgi:ADP-ribose pyrophosphatase YjhB (NUDIX family)|nr:NUDIX hydrolase [Oscillospiraceae bacterium]
MDLEQNNNWSQSVAGVLIREGRVLLARHTYGSGKGKLIIPGGYCKFGETPQDALKREWLEETGLCIEPREIVSIRFNMHDWYIVFRVEAVGGTETPDGKEISEIVWVDLPELEKRGDVANLSKRNIHACAEKRGLERTDYESQGNAYPPYSLYL